MKRILFALFFLLTTLLEFVYAQDNNAIYVYRNDGIVHGFLKQEIDSITLSHLDLDSIYHTQVVCQEFWTIDSVYRVPIEVIDSVSFITPDTKLQPGVTELSDDFLQYVIRQDSAELVLDSSIPQQLLPQVGDKVLLTAFNSKITSGVAGVVTDVLHSADDELIVRWAQTELTEIFETYYSIVLLTQEKVDGYLQQPETRAFGINSVESSGDLSLNLGTFSYSFDIVGKIGAINDLVDKKVGAGVSMSVNPRLKVRSFVMISKELGNNYSVAATGEFNFEESFQVYGSLNFDKDYTAIKFNVPIDRMGLTKFFLEEGLFLHSSASLSVGASASQKFKFGMSYEHSSRNQQSLKNTAPFCRLAEATPVDVSLSVDGHFAVGIYSKVGFAFIDSRLLSVAARTETGLELEGNLVLRKSDINNTTTPSFLYTLLKNGECKLNLYRSLMFEKQYAGTLEIGHDIFPRWTKNLLTGHFAPDFDNLSWDLDPENITSGTLDGTVSGDLLFPITLGWGLYDSSDKLYKTYYFPSDYRIVKNWKNQGMKMYIDGLKTGTIYTAYPIMKVFSAETRSDEGVTVSTGPNIQTVGACDFTARKATLKGSCEFDNKSHPVKPTVYFEYKPKSKTSWSRIDATLDNDFCFEARVSGLSEDTEYDFRAVCEMDSEEYEASPKSFRTKKLPVPTTLSATSVTRNSATLSGSFDYMDDGAVGSIELIGGSSQGQKTSNGTLAVKVSDLKPKTTYRYRAVVLYDGERILAKAQEFTTEALPLAVTGDAEVNEHSVTLSCTFEDVPLGAQCGVIVEGQTYSMPALNGTHTKTLDDLEEGTYHYRAFILHAGNYYYGDERQFVIGGLMMVFCPDGAHPHFIDLGLPSGTKWCCCNLGANSPTGAGRYYDYGKFTYIPFDSELGSQMVVKENISGTSYDAAKAVNSRWRIPDFDQVLELEFHTHYIMHTMDGMNGVCVQGKNGNCIFFPAVGYYDGGDELMDYGVQGRYRAGYQPTDEWGVVGEWYLRIGEDYAWWTIDMTCGMGFSIRPVSKTAN